MIKKKDYGYLAVPVTEVGGKPRILPRQGIDGYAMPVFECEPVMFPIFSLRADARAWAKEKTSYSGEKFRICRVTIKE